MTERDVAIMIHRERTKRDWVKMRKDVRKFKRKTRLEKNPKCIAERNRIINNVESLTYDETYSFSPGPPKKGKEDALDDSVMTMDTETAKKEMFKDKGLP